MGQRGGQWGGQWGGNESVDAAARNAGMRSRSKYPRYLGEAALFWLLLPFVRMLGLDIASDLFGFLGRRLGSRLAAPLPANRNMRRRIAMVMPEKSGAEIDAIIAGMWEHLGRMMAEMPFLSRFADLPWSARITLQGIDNFYSALDGECGVFLLTGHIGNWELLPPILSHLAGEHGMVGVYRPLNNPFLDAPLSRLRQRAMNAAPLPNPGRREMIPKTGDQRKNIHDILRALQRREGVVMLVDQKTSQGMEARFFGLPAMTTHLPARLAISGGHVLLPLFVTRQEGVNFTLRFDEPIPVPAPPASDGAVLALTQRINDVIEAQIRAHPQQWLWLHNRWFANIKPKRD